MRREFKTFLSDTSGSDLIELALVLPLLVLLLVGIADFGRYCYASIEITNAANAAAQYGAQNHVTASDTTGMQNIAKADAADVTGITVTPTHFCVCADGTASNCASGSCTSSRVIEFVQVSTSATISPIFSHYAGLPNSLTLRGQAIVRVEQ